MTDTQIIILLDLVLTINIFIQAIWFYLWLKDRKENKTIKYLTHLVDDNLEIKNHLMYIKLNTLDIKRNTFNPNTKSNKKKKK